MKPSKNCAACGRTMTWRKAWAANWDQMRYCSARCRRRRPTSDLDRELERCIEELLDRRGAGKTICPSEAARSVRPDDWRDHMERTQQAARRLVTAGRLEIVQRGRVVDPSTARGAIRLRAIRLTEE